MTTIRKTAIAAVAAITIAAAMASPAQAKKKFNHGHFWAGVGAAAHSGTQRRHAYHINTAQPRPNTTRAASTRHRAHTRMAWL